jgi:uncharacterized protein YjbI with pentapeptide repeats
MGRTPRPGELESVLDAHRKWLESDGKEGVRADLSRVDLRGAKLGAIDLRKARLQRTDFRYADLREADFREADLKRAKFRRAKLESAKLQGAKLRDAMFYEADLTDADLTDSKRLFAENLAGAILTGAKLPEDLAKFEGLKQQEETSKNARRMHFTMLLGCAYAWLTIATTTDVRLVANSASSPLPIIQTEIPIAGFYWAAPIILLSLYFYLHLYLQQLWRGYAALPARFPDGKALDERVYPWLLNGLIRAHLRRLRGTRPTLSRLQNGVAILLAWWVVPLTLVAFWLRYLPRHDKWGSGFHLDLIVLSALFGLYAYWLARATLRRKDNPFRWKKARGDGRAWLVLGTVGLGAVLSLATLGAIDGSRTLLLASSKDRPELFGPRTWVPWAFQLVGYRTYADLANKDISARPKDWWTTAKANRNLATVAGAKLAGRDLRYASANHAFLVNADLLRAKLEGANLLFADLRKANLLGADLRGATLGFADLRGAELDCKTLTKATNWEYAYRDPALACGEDIPKPPPKAGKKPD